MQSFDWWSLSCTDWFALRCLLCFSNLDSIKLGGSSESVPSFGLPGCASSGNRSVSRIAVSEELCWTPSCGQAAYSFNSNWVYSPASWPMNWLFDRNPSFSMSWSWTDRSVAHSGANSNQSWRAPPSTNSSLPCSCQYSTMLSHPQRQTSCYTTNS